MSWRTGKGVSVLDHFSVGQPFGGRDAGLIGILCEKELVLCGKGVTVYVTPEKVGG
jgi:hypothetical protein